MPQLMRKTGQREEEAKFAELQARATARLERIAAPARKPAEIARALDEFDSRSRARVVVDFPALVICEADEDTPATIVDMSEDGLRLRFARPHFIESSILLDSPAFKGFVVAEVKWQSGVEAGVAFDHLWTKRLAAPLR